MAESIQTVEFPMQRATVKTQVVYALYLPKKVMLFEELVEMAPYQVRSYPFYPVSDSIVVSIDLITAARLKLIRPGDDSGLGDEQWAWIKLIGLTGEN